MGLENMLHEQSGSAGEQPDRTKERAAFSPEFAALSALFPLLCSENAPFILVRLSAQVRISGMNLVLSR